MHGNSSIAKGRAKMAKSIADQAANYIGESVRTASQFTSTVADAVEKGISEKGEKGISMAKRAAADGRDAAQDFLDDTAKRVKRSPIASILFSLAAGVAVGFLVGRATSSE
jgi:ElaB/YqjD/DUF883 family membrane-anchored ribosome-binding protein